MLVLPLWARHVRRDRPRAGVISQSILYWKRSFVCIGGLAVAKVNVKLVAGVGEQIRESRRGSGMTLSALAGLVGVSASTLSQIENGRMGVSDQRLRDLGQHIDLDLELLGIEGGVAEDDHGSVVDWRSYAPLTLDPVAAAALSLFVEKGYHGTSIRDIAGALGRSISGIYHRHASKQDVLVYLMELTMTDLATRIERAGMDGRDPAERFGLMVECLALYHIHRQDLAFLGATEMRALEPECRERITALRRRVQLLMELEVNAARKAGLFNPLNPHHAARSITYMCVSIARWYRPGGAMGADDVAAETVTYALSVMRG